MDYKIIEDMVSELVDSDGITYEHAVEILRQQIDDLYGSRGTVSSIDELFPSPARVCK